MFLCYISLYQKGKTDRLKQKTKGKTKGTLNKDMACEAIKDFYTNYR